MLVLSRTPLTTSVRYPNTQHDYVTLGFLAPSSAAVLEYFKKRIPEIISRLIPPNPKNPTFKLLKLPWLALKEVLKTMEHQNVFMLSLCSKNTFFLLKTFKLKANLYYIDRDCDLSVYSLQSNDHRELIFSMRYTYDNNHWVEKEQSVIRLKIELAELRVWKKDYPNLSKVTDLWISHTSETHLKYILEKYPNLKSLRVNGVFYEDVAVYPNLLNVEHVFLENCYYRASYLIKSFQGRNLAISRARIHANEVLNFVNNWISGKEYFNLEVFLVSNVDLIINFALISNELKILEKKWNRPTVYEYWSRAIVTKRSAREKIDLSGNEYKIFMDFERKADRKMATLMLSDLKLAFIVWN
ncbi:unnamed protein product [Caenorhabditis brenneri]